MRISRVACTLLGIFWFSFLFAQHEESLPADSTTIILRTIDAQVIEQLKADPDMDYGRTPAAQSLWQRFLRWLRNLFRSLFETIDTDNWLTWLIGILCLVGLTYAIVALMHRRGLRVFYQKETGLTVTPIEEDIHAMDFEQLLQDALSHQEYRLAIRLLFLNALKLLTDKQLIHWQPGKTNHDYLGELSAPHLKAGFHELNFFFEYAWYGNFSINESMFNRVHSIFNNWRNSLS